MSTYLEILSDAIQDAGHWRWWTSDLPAIFQLEFGGVQLYSPPPQPDQPPPSLIALRFHNPASITFITFPDSPPNLPADWPNKLQNDAIDPLGISYETFHFNNLKSIRDMFQQVAQSTTIFGPSPISNEFDASNITLSFRAGYAGLIVAAQSLTILNHQGEIPPNQIEEKHNQWWTYWQEYWRRRDTPNPFPTDYACEVTIPVSE